MPTALVMEYGTLPARTVGDRIALTTPSLRCHLFYYRLLLLKRKWSPLEVTVYDARNFTLLALPKLCDTLKTFLAISL